MLKLTPTNPAIGWDLLGLTMGMPDIDVNAWKEYIRGHIRRFAHECGIEAIRIFLNWPVASPQETPIWLCDKQIVVKKDNQTWSTTLNPYYFHEMLKFVKEICDLYNITLIISLTGYTAHQVLLPVSDTKTGLYTSHGTQFCYQLIDHLVELLGKNIIIEPANESEVGMNAGTYQSKKANALKIAQFHFNILQRMKNFGMSSSHLMINQTEGIDFETGKENALCTSMITRMLHGRIGYSGKIRSFKPIENLDVIVSYHGIDGAKALDRTGLLGQRRIPVDCPCSDGVEMRGDGMVGNDLRKWVCEIGQRYKDRLKKRMTGKVSLLYLHHPRGKSSSATNKSGGLYQLIPEYEKHGWAKIASYETHLENVLAPDHGFPVVQAWNVLYGKNPGNWSQHPK